MPNVSEMLQERPHLHDELKRFRRLASFLEEVNRHFADLRRRIIELSDEELEGPFVGFGAREDELTEVLSRVESDVLFESEERSARRREMGEIMTYHVARSQSFGENDSRMTVAETKERERSSRQFRG